MKVDVTHQRAEASDASAMSVTFSVRYMLFPVLFCVFCLVSVVHIDDLSLCIARVYIGYAIHYRVQMIIKKFRLGTYGLTHLRLLQSPLGKLRLDLTSVQSRLVRDKSRFNRSDNNHTICKRVVARVKL